MYQLVKDMPRALKWAFLLLMDVFWVPIALLIAFVLHTSTLGVMDFPLVNKFAAIALMGVSMLLSIVTNTYRIQLKSYERRAVGLTAIHTLALGLFAYVLDRLAEYGSAWSVFLIFMLSYFLLAVSARVILLQALLAVHRLGTDQIRVLVYGAGETGRQLVAALRTDENILAVGYVDDNRSLQGSLVQGLRVHSPQVIQALARRKRADRILLAMPSLPRSELIQRSRELEMQGLVVQSLPSFAQLAQGKAIADQLESVVPGRFLGRDALDGELSIASSVYANRSVLISGAGGSIGSELCRQVVLTQPSKLVLFEVSEHALYEIHRELLVLTKDAGVRLIPVLGSVTNEQHVQRALAEHKVEVVLHAAAYKHVPIVEQNIFAGVENNVFGTQVLASEAVKANVHRFIYVSTDKAVRPSSVMGATKRIAELLIKDMARKAELSNHTTIFSMVRFGNVIGSSGSVLPLFEEQIRKGGPVTLTHPEMTRYFMTIPEAARLVLLAGSFADSGDLFILDMGEPIKIADLARQMIEAAGYAVRSHDDPQGDIEIAVTGLRPGEKLHEELMLGEGKTAKVHAKILKAEEPWLSEVEVASAMRGLKEKVDQFDNEGLQQELSRWVDSNSANEKATPLELTKIS